MISFNPTRFPVWHKHSMVNMLTVKEKIPQYTETRFVFLLLRQLYCTLHSTKLLKLDSDTVLLYILISYITAWRRKTLQSESRSSTVFWDPAFAEERRSKCAGGGSIAVTTCAEAAFRWGGQNEQKWTHPALNSPLFQLNVLSGQQEFVFWSHRGAGRWQGCRRSWFWLLLRLVASRFWE